MKYNSLLNSLSLNRVNNNIESKLLSHHESQNYIHAVSDVFISSCFVFIAVCSFPMFFHSSGPGGPAWSSEIFIIINHEILLLKGVDRQYSNLGLP